MENVYPAVEQSTANSGKTTGKMDLILVCTAHREVKRNSRHPVSKTAEMLDYCKRYWL